MDQKPGICRLVRCKEISLSHFPHRPPDVIKRGHSLRRDHRISLAQIPQRSAELAVPRAEIMASMPRKACIYWVCDVLKIIDPELN